MKTVKGRQIRMEADFADDPLKEALKECFEKKGWKVFSFLLLASVASAFAGDPYDVKETVAEVQFPERVFTNAAGSVVVDFGKDAFGWLEIDAPAAGREYFMNIGEILRGKTGHVDRKPGQSVRALGVMWHTERAGFQRVPVAPDLRNLFTAGEGSPVKIPEKFGLVSPFRAVEFYRADFPVTSKTVRRFVVSYPADRTESSFACDDEKLVRVYDFCKYSMFATSFAGMFVDGDRERIPYEADAYVSQLNWYAVSSDYAYPRKAIEYLYAHPTWPTEFKQASVMSAWTDWMWTGDTRSIAKHYDMLKDEKMLLGHVRTSDGLLVSGGERPPWPCYTNRCGLADIVDWPKPEREDFDFRDVNAVVNAFHCRTLEQMRDIAGVLGKADDAADFAARAERAKSAYAKVFIDSGTGLVVDGEGSRHSSVQANAIALAFGLVPQENAGRVADWLVAQGMGCSVYFANYLLEGLFRAGRGDAAFALLTAENDRSWLGMLDQGATMTMEAWNMKVKPNQDINHAWGATAINVISRFVLGVTPFEPGFGKISIRPNFGPLKRVSATVPTQAGPVRIEFADGRLSVASPAPAVVDWRGRTIELSGTNKLQEIKGGNQ